VGILTRLFEKRASLTDREIVELLNGGQMDNATGVVVTPETALQSTAVFACVRIIAETLASLPLITYRRLTRGKERAQDFYLYSKLHDSPNPEMSSLVYREAITSHVALWGNGYSEIELDQAGRVVNLWPLLPNQTKPQRDPKTGEIAYTTYVPGKGTYVLPSYRVFHVRGLGMNGLLGLSPIAMARRAVGLALGTEEYGARFFGNNAQPGVVLKHPGTLSDEAYKRMTSSWNEAHMGLSNAHRAAILEEGTGIEKIGVPPEDAQFLETRKFQTTEIARLYRIPPHMLADLDRATFSNIEQQSLEFVMYTMAPWLARWEQEISRSLLLERERSIYFAEFLVDGLLRGDIASRYGAYAIGRQWGWLSANDVREKENMNPREGGDGYLSPLNMVETREGEGQAQGLPQRMGETGEAVQEWPSLYDGNGKR